MLIFLDMDGVLCTNKSYQLYDDLIDPKCMQALNYLVMTLKADIVISSTWRIEGLAHLQEVLKTAGLNGNVVGLTPYVVENSTHPRGKEILKYMEDNNYTGDYMVIDDEVSDIRELSLMLI